MGDDVVRARVEAVLAVVDAESEGPDLEVLATWQQHIVAGLIVDLIRLGLVDPEGEAGPEVPVALKAAVAKGATLAMAYFAAMKGLLDEGSSVACRGQTRMSEAHGMLQM